MRLHGLVYDINDGVLKDLQVNDDVVTELEHIYGTKAMKHAEKQVEEIHNVKPEAGTSHQPEQFASKKKNGPSAEKEDNQLLSVS